MGSYPFSVSGSIRLGRMLGHPQVLELTKDRAEGYT